MLSGRNALHTRQKRTPSWSGTAVSPVRCTVVHTDVLETFEVWAVHVTGDARMSEHTAAGPPFSSTSRTPWTFSVRSPSSISESESPSLAAKRTYSEHTEPRASHMEVPGAELTLHILHGRRLIYTAALPMMKRTLSCCASDREEWVLCVGQCL